MRVGLTGGIGSGKSTVAGFLVEAGATLIDTDALARQLTEPGGAAMPAIAQEFGAGFVSPEGALDRAAMRELAFQDAGAKRRLEAILHPLIGQQADALAAAAAGAPLLVFDVPLLVESGRWRARVHRILVVDCAESTQIARVMQRNGWTEDAVRRIIAQQASREQRRAVADAVILNEGLTLEALAESVRQVWSAWGLDRRDAPPA